VHFDGSSPAARSDNAMSAVRARKSAGSYGTVMAW